MLERPDHPGQHRRGHLQRRGVVVRRHPPRLFDRQPRAEPINPFGRAHQQDPELVDPRCDLVHHQTFRGPAAASSCRRIRANSEPRRRMGDRRSGRSAGIDPAAIRDGQKVGDGDRFAVGDQKSVIRAFKRRPAAHPRRRPGPQQIDRRTAAEIMAAAIGREMPFMRPPAELRRLRAFADEAVDRPGVDEFARLLRDRRDLGIAFGDMNNLDAETLGEAGPIAARCRGCWRRASKSRARSISACLTKCETRPGLAPWVRTAVGPRGKRRRSASALSRSA